MKNIRLIALFSVFCLMLLVPTVYAMDNQTVLDANDDVNVTGAVYYFDANVDDNTGNGFVNSPYRNLTPGRVNDSSVNYLSDGEYWLEGQINKRNVTFIGQSPQNTIIKYNDVGFRANNILTLQNLTLVGLSVSDYSNSIITAKNVIFKDSISGSISTTFANTYVYLENCTFLNNHANSAER